MGSGSSRRHQSKQSNYREKHHEKVNHRNSIVRRIGRVSITLHFFVLALVNMQVLTGYGVFTFEPIFNLGGTLAVVGSAAITQIAIKFQQHREA